MKSTNSDMPRLGYSGSSAPPFDRAADHHIETAVHAATGSSVSRVLQEHLGELDLPVECGQGRLQPAENLDQLFDLLPQQEPRRHVNLVVQVIADRVAQVITASLPGRGRAALKEGTEDRVAQEPQEPEGSASVSARRSLSFS